jgi:hypothetical protein
MNQRADSWKKNLQPNVAKALINQRGWLLSHTMRCSRSKNRIRKAFEGVVARFFASGLPNPAVFNLSEHRGRQVTIEQNESGRRERLPSNKARC